MISYFITILLLFPVTTKGAVTGGRNVDGSGGHDIMHQEHTESNEQLGGDGTDEQLGESVLEAPPVLDVGPPEGHYEATPAVCKVPKCVYSGESLDSALSTFLCTPDYLTSKMEEQEKKSLLAHKIDPHIVTDVEELKMRSSFELVELINLVTYGAKLNKKSHKKSPKQYMDALIRTSASAVLHKPLGAVVEEDLGIFQDVSPIILLMTICPVTTPATDTMDADIDQVDEATSRDGRIVNKPGGFGDCSGYRCWSGECIAGTWVCDGMEDCDDGTDEKGCPEGYCGYKCHSGECLYSEFVCDGTDDCEDGSDEMGCPGFEDETFLTWFFK